jgi:hypothetical protein
MRQLTKELAAEALEAAVLSIVLIALVVLLMSL